MFDICCIGHITADKVVTRHSVNYMPGGTAYYFSYALSKLDVNYLLVTSLGAKEQDYVNHMRGAGIEVKAQIGKNTVYFENIYGDNPDEREQQVLQKADPFTAAQLAAIDAKIFHLGPLLADDISVAIVKMLAARGKVSLDVQGYLRKVVNKKVYLATWENCLEILPHIAILKADEAELAVLTGERDVDVGARYLLALGIKEVVITNGSKGSKIYTGENKFVIPAYVPEISIDTTGCGDTYMAGYLYQRVKGTDIKKSGAFAAAMAGLKTAFAGPFVGTGDDITGILINGFI